MAWARGRRGADRGDAAGERRGYSEGKPNARRIDARDAAAPRAATPGRDRAPRRYLQDFRHLGMEEIEAVKMLNVFLKANRPSGHRTL